MSFVATNAQGDKQTFNFWSTHYGIYGDQYCGFFHGFRLTSWTFPYGVSINLTYQQPAPGQFDDLVQVSNSLGRAINFVSSGLGGFNNGLSGADLRTVTAPGPIDRTMTSVTHTEPTGAQTTINMSLSGGKWLLLKVLRADPTTQNNTASQPEIAYTYDTLERVQLAQDAVALQVGGRNAYSFYLAEGARAERLDPAGGQYTIINDIYRRPMQYIDELGNATTVTHDGRGRVSSYTYPEGNQEVLAYDDHNNTTSLKRWAKPHSIYAGSPITVSAAWDQTWNKPHTITDALGCTTTLDYYRQTPACLSCRTQSDVLRTPLNPPSIRYIPSLIVRSGG